LCVGQFFSISQGLKCETFEQPSLASKTAFCIKNKKDLKNFSDDEFFIAILQGYYNSVTELTKIQFEVKQGLQAFRTCVWDKCRKSTKTCCNNKGCAKLACEQHLLVICNTCFFDCVLKREVFYNRPVDLLNCLSR
jgi:hypothetical protein